MRSSVISQKAILHIQLQPLMNHGLAPENHCLCLAELPELPASHAPCTCITHRWLGEPKIPNPCVSLCLLCSHSLAKQALDSLSASTPALPPASGLALAKLFRHRVPIRAGPLLPPEGTSFPCAAQKQGRRSPALTDTTESPAAAQVEP